jgi:hypothetical protein
VVGSSVGSLVGGSVGIFVGLRVGTLVNIVGCFVGVPTTSSPSVSGGVGSCVGSAAGGFDGFVVAAKVGPFVVGDSVGTLDGSSVGTCVFAGFVVLEPASAQVGASVGESVGSLVGSLDLSFVGGFVGMLEGAFDGISVGSFVGSLDGNLVGGTVGSKVLDCRTFDGASVSMFILPQGAKSHTIITSHAVVLALLHPTYPVFTHTSWVKCLDCFPLLASALLESFWKFQFLISSYHI